MIIHVHLWTGHKSFAIISIRCSFQGYCGSSYAFSAMGALEGATALAHGKLIGLSEQNIIDCSGQWGTIPWCADDSLSLSCI